MGGCKASANVAGRSEGEHSAIVENGPLLAPENRPAAQTARLESRAFVVDQGRHREGCTNVLQRETRRVVPELAPYLQRAGRANCTAFPAATIGQKGRPFCPIRAESIHPNREYLRRRGQRQGGRTRSVCGEITIWCSSVVPLAMQKVEGSNPFSRFFTNALHMANSPAAAGLHLADLSSDLRSATGPRCVSLSGLTIALMLLI